MRELKSHNNSRAGNDCWIHEFWYWCEPLRVAVKVDSATGWADRGASATVYEEASNDMPNEVRQWFEGGGIK